MASNLRTCKGTCLNLETRCLVGGQAAKAAEAPIVSVRFFLFLPPKNTKNLSPPRNFNRSGRYSVHITFGLIAKVPYRQKFKIGP